MSGLQNPIVVLAVIAWLAAPPHSLGEAAQKEAFRRAIMPKSRASLTNIGHRSEIPVMAAAAPVSVGEASEPKGAQVKKNDKENDKHDEAWWRKRVDTARQTVDRDQMMADALQTRINSLQRDVVNRDNPGQQANLRQELQKTLAELENAKKQVETDRDAIRAIQEEARRLDVPAGWIRY